MTVPGNTINSISYIKIRISLLKPVLKQQLTPLEQLNLMATFSFNGSAVSGLDRGEMKEGCGCFCLL